MNFNSKSSIRGLLKSQGLKPKKRLGQNFLIDRGITKKIITAADLSLKDTVLEIGPGLGVLTFELTKTAKKVIAVEKDPDMVKILDGRLKAKNLKVVQGDILKILDSEELPLGSYKVIGNLPFYITSSIIRRFLERSKNPPLQMILTVQKEVAQRICAKPPNMSLLAVSVQFYSDPKIISYVSKKSFWPQPEVDAAVINIRTRKSNLKKAEKNLFFKIAKAGFSRPRKQLANNLSKNLGIGKIKAGEWLKKNNIRPDQRAETLSLEDWIKLTKSF